MNGQITICIFQAKMLTPMSSRRCLQTWTCLQFAFGWKQVTLNRGLRSVTQSQALSTNWHYLGTSWPSMERIGNRKIMLARENIHCYCFFVQQMSFFADKEVLNSLILLRKNGRKNHACSKRVAPTRYVSDGGLGKLGQSPNAPN